MNNIEMAVIDQVVAGQFSHQVYAFSAVHGEKGWQLVVAVANESGYNPVEGKIFEEESEARRWAAELNAHIGRDSDSVTAIIGSTMRGPRVELVK
jgi:hypothetical protein